MVLIRVPIIFSIVIILLFLKYIKKCVLSNIYLNDLNVIGDGNISGGYLTICSVPINEVDSIQINGSRNIIPKMQHIIIQAKKLTFLSIVPSPSYSV